MKKVLIVEDDLEIQELIKYFFEKENYKVDKTDDGLKALKILKKEKSDVIILDLMLPGIDGKNFAKIVRSLPEEYGNPKIIMVTAKTEIEDVLEGLEIGADDYLKKPFDPRELVLRVKKLLKEDKQEKKEERIYKFSDIELDIDTHMVLVKGEEIELSKKEYDLLLLLVRNKGLVVTREKILDEVWNSNYYTGDRTVDVYISKLREKIPLLSDSIHTVKGVGYKLKEKK
ncbi:MAG: response regulator transcription factor [Fusobacterium perfoetens]|uniref:response regulator transcription factor n=1 Tax=Fusobacterium perfoetens TaxID=852 RepID=UPI0023F52C52|nr:response regulator transcription factor [Fusobacterium perfoetens]MCI6152163.1 response regulator transcription factor [Fusobacterium perfoetens]MDY3237946.1 response regulator transcription factor [Fusobacterium perfoetens]